LKKGSKAAKAWGAKMRRLRGTKKQPKKKKRKTGLTRYKQKRSTRKYGVRKTARRAYVGLKRRVSRRKKTDSTWNF
jgi:hypothetical protein